MASSDVGDFCTNGPKRRYVSRSEAAHALAVLARTDRRRRGVVGMRAYLCENCGGYHLGHDNKPGRPKRRRKIWKR